MFKHIGIVAKIFLFLGLLAFLHYNLPDRDIVRVVGTDVKRMDGHGSFWQCGGADAGTERLESRDVRYINTVRPNGDVMIYCNEDTGWGWPPYFKFDTSDLAGQADNLANQDGSGEKVWVAVTHYGWRIRFFTMHPNVLSIEEVDGPNAKLIPWFNIVFLTALLGFFFWLWWKWRGFRKARIDPVTEKIGASVDSAVNTVSGTVSGATSGMRNKDSGFRKFMRRWFGSK